MAPSATLSLKFQISIPKAVRDEQQWKAGQRFVFVPKGKGVLIMPVPELRELAGVVAGAKRDGFRDRKDRYCMLQNCIGSTSLLPPMQSFMPQQSSMAPTC